MESRRAARGCVDAAPCTLPRDTRQPGSIAEGEDAGLGRTNVHVAHPLYSVTGGVVEFAEGGRAVVVAPHLLEQVGQNLRAPCLSRADISIVCVRVISPFPQRTGMALAVRACDETRYVKDVPCDDHPQVPLAAVCFKLLECDSLPCSSQGGDAAQHGVNNLLETGVLVRIFIRHALASPDPRLPRARPACRRSHMIRQLISQDRRGAQHVRRVIASACTDASACTPHARGTTYGDPSANPTASPTRRPVSSGSTAARVLQAPSCCKQICRETEKRSGTRIAHRAHQSPACDVHEDQATVRHGGGDNAPGAHGARGSWRYGCSTLRRGQHYLSAPPTPSAGLLSRLLAPLLQLIHVRLQGWAQRRAATHSM